MTNDQINKAVIIRAQNGEASAVGRLYQHLSESVYRYLYYRVGDRHAAEDLTGEVFLRMIQALPNYQPQLVPFRAWVFQIARNLAVDHFRRLSVRNHRPLDDALEAGNTPLERAAELSITSDSLRDALNELGDDQRDVIILRFVAEMPIAETAATLGKSESAVKALQHRALKTLRSRLEELKVIYV